jgi:hypothetical protein
MDDYIGYTFQNVGKALPVVKPALRQVSFKVSIEECAGSWQDGGTRSYNLFPMNISSTFQKTRFCRW